MGKTKNYQISQLRFNDKAVLGNIINNMNEEQKWSDMSNDLSNVAKKIKLRIDEEDLVEDLKKLLKIQ